MAYFLLTRATKLRNAWVDAIWAIPQSVLLILINTSVMSISRDVIELAIIAEGVFGANLLTGPLFHMDFIIISTKMIFIAEILYRPS